jgi:RNA polymerase sigma-70 factor (ECF subfamily)
VRLLNPQSLVWHTDRLQRAAWALCGSRPDAEDLVQETFARVLGRRDASRRPRAVVALEDVQVLDWHATQAPQQALEVGELYAAIAELPERYRLTLVAVDLLGLSYGEAGRSLGVGEATVATRLFRARRLIVGRLAGEMKPAHESVPRIRPRELSLGAGLEERAA